MSTDRSGDIHVTVQVSTHMHAYIRKFSPPLLFCINIANMRNNQGKCNLRWAFVRWKTCGSMHKTGTQTQACTQVRTHTHWIWNFLWITNRRYHNITKVNNSLGDEKQQTNNKVFHLWANAVAPSIVWEKFAQYLPNFVYKWQRIYLMWDLF